MTDLSYAVFLADSKSIIYLAKMPTMMRGVNGLFVSSGVPPKFDPIVMREFVLVSGWFRCLAERRP